MSLQATPHSLDCFIAVNNLAVGGVVVLVPAGDGLTLLRLASALELVALGRVGQTAGTTIVVTAGVGARAGRERAGLALAPDRVNTGRGGRGDDGEDDKGQGGADGNHCCWFCGF